jgi:hypothetical protein
MSDDTKNLRAETALPDFGPCLRCDLPAVQAEPRRCAHHLGEPPGCDDCRARSCERNDVCYCGCHRAEQRRPTATASEPPFVTLSDRLVASMAKFADDHALPLTLKSQKGQTAIVLDDNGICVLDTTTPDKPCDFDCMVVDAVNCVSGLAREVQWHRANRGGERAIPETSPVGWCEGSHGCATAALACTNCHRLVRR